MDTTTMPRQNSYREVAEILGNRRVRTGWAALLAGSRALMTGKQDVAACCILERMGAILLGWWTLGTFNLKTQPTGDPYRFLKGLTEVGAIDGEAFRAAQEVYKLPRGRYKAQRLLGLLATLAGGLDEAFQADIDQPMDDRSSTPR